MTYVDKIFYWPAHRHQYWCHLLADTEAELHAMADRIGLRRSWYQPRPKASIPHYDLTPAKRKLAVRAGAVEMETLEITKRWREKNPSGNWTTASTATGSSPGPS